MRGPGDERFVAPDFGAPLDLEARLRACPSGEVKGMLFEPTAGALRRMRRPVPRPRYLAFRGYPLTEWLQFLADGAAALHPALPPREGLRRIGWNAYGAVTQSTAGAVLFGLAGRSPDLAVGLAQRAYEILGAHGRVALVAQRAGRAVFEFRGFWDWIDAYQVGVLEGALRAFGLHGEVRCRTLGICDADLEVVWE